MIHSASYFILTAKENPRNCWTILKPAMCYDEFDFCPGCAKHVLCGRLVLFLFGLCFLSLSVCLFVFVFVFFFLVLVSFCYNVWLTTVCIFFSLREA